ncbi:MULTISPECIES: hypothetical protein [Agrobacterium tumefaciens complex]|uniref:hypothetical protein n=1 Tax=Agrobacterium tumefaciens complex TaxID=1183400 RepID=UPI0022434982|nr:hypothetical protein [Agrobacterium tumefaciens]MCW8059479.1 hypothetical protein [Agrobacterium tumefaciens]MCW8146208.1 hypothetical protein [Agrobacterium tumefaciens]
MDDSENSRSLSIVTRRRVLSVLAALLASQASASEEARGPETPLASEADYRVIALWRKWLKAHDETQRLCELQQGVESRMVVAVGFPQVKIALPGRAVTVWASSQEEIDRICGDAPEHQTIKAEALTALRERQEAWDRLDEAWGYSHAQKAEIRSDRLEMELAKALWAEPTISTTGAIAKLHSILVTGEQQGLPDEFPWLELRMVLDDLSKNVLSA